MRKCVIHIYGASGSGTTTLAKYIADNLGYRFIDSDDYYWEPTDPPYRRKRPIPERIRLMKEELEQSHKAVISGSLTDWGDSLIPFFTLAVRLVTPTEIRIARIKEREKRKFGSRIAPGGDMYEAHCQFLIWASGYDTGGLDTRSKAKHDQWEKLLACPRIILDGSGDLDWNLEQIRKAAEEAKTGKEQ